MHVEPWQYRIFHQIGGRADCYSTILLVSCVDVDVVRVTDQLINVLFHISIVN